MLTERCNSTGETMLPLGLQLASLLVLNAAPGGEALPAAAEHIMEQASCHTEAQDFQVMLRSPSGEPVEDDMRLLFVQDGHEQEVSPEPAWMELSRPPPGSPSLCQGATMVRVGTNRVLMALVLNGRPQLDYLVAVAYDLKARKVLAWKVLGEFYRQQAHAPAQLHVSTEHFRALLVSAHPHDDTTGMVETWLEVGFDGRAITSSWNRGLRQARMR